MLQLGITSADQLDRILTRAADLKIQAMMFDMSIDWETLQLVPKVQDMTPSWIKKWNEKRDEADYNELTDMDWE